MDANARHFVPYVGAEDQSKVRGYGTEKNTGKYFVWEIMLRNVPIDGAVIEVQRRKGWLPMSKEIEQRRCYRIALEIFGLSYSIYAVL